MPGSRYALCFTLFLLLHCSPGVHSANTNGHDKGAQLEYSLLAGKSRSPGLQKNGMGGSSASIFQQRKSRSIASAALQELEGRLPADATTVDTNCVHSWVREKLIENRVPREIIMKAVIAVSAGYKWKDDEVPSTKADLLRRSLNALNFERDDLSTLTAEAQKDPVFKLTTPEPVVEIKQEPLPLSIFKEESFPSFSVKSQDQEPPSPLSNIIKESFLPSSVKNQDSTLEVSNDDEQEVAAIFSSTPSLGEPLSEEVEDFLEISPKAQKAWTPELEYDDEYDLFPRVGTPVSHASSPVTNQGNEIIDDLQTLKTDSEGDPQLEFSRTTDTPKPKYSLAFPNRSWEMAKVTGRQHKGKLQVTGALVLTAVVVGGIIFAYKKIRRRFPIANSLLNTVVPKTCHVLVDFEKGYLSKVMGKVTKIQRVDVNNATRVINVSYMERPALRTSGGTDFFRWLKYRASLGLAPIRREERLGFPENCMAGKHSGFEVAEKDGQVLRMMVDLDLYPGPLIVPRDFLESKQVTDMLSGFEHDPTWRLYSDCVMHISIDIPFNGPPLVQVEAARGRVSFQNPELQHLSSELPRECEWREPWKMMLVYKSDGKLPFELLLMMGAADPSVPIWEALLRKQGNAKLDAAITDDDMDDFGMRTLLGEE